MCLGGSFLDATFDQAISFMLDNTVMVCFETMQSKYENNSTLKILYGTRNIETRLQVYVL